jgi:phage minor structural protein, N-terminal domain protein|nr:MAG TPA: Neck appendage protein [Caudoviricetes sp.]
MIYLTDGNIPLNAAYDDNVIQEANSTYQLSFKFPTNNVLWQRLREETFLTADDLHGEQDFVIFEVEKKHGYIQVYANQVFTLLNNYVVNPISLDRVTGSTALSRFAGSITRDNSFSFFSDIDNRHTFNSDTMNAMEALTKDKHSILGQWGGDLVRHGYQVRLLKNGGSENESLFMYKKNLSSYQHKTSTKSLKTRITFKTTVKGEGENADDKHYKVVVDSQFIEKYSQIYEDVVEVNDQDVKDEASLREYGRQYFLTSLCDLVEDSIEIDVIGQSDVPVQMFDIVSIYHETFDLDVRKKITKYTYSPMAKKLKSIGFGKFKSGLANAIGNVVSDAVKNETQHLEGKFEAKLAKEIRNADLVFDRKKEELTNQFTDEVNVIKAKSEEDKQKLSDEINRRFQEFSPSGLEEIKAKSEEALKKAGTSENLAKEAKKIADENVKNLNTFKVTAERAQTAISGDLDTLKRTVTSEVNQASEHRRTTTEALSRMTGQMNGFATKSEVKQDVTGLTETFAKLKTDTNNLISGAKSEITLAKTEFKTTADGLSAKMSAVESYVDQDGQRQEALRRYTREESARQATAVRDLVTRDYVGKSTYQEDVRGLERRFSAISTQTNNNIATKIAQYKQTVDGQFASITSQMAGKVNQTDFQRVKETSQLYERILGNTEQGLPDKISRLVMTNEIFQTEVGKYVTDDNNLIVNSMTMDKHTLVNANRNGVNVSVNEGVFTVKANGLTSYNFSGFTLPIYVKKIYRGETYTLGFKYRIREKVDTNFVFVVKNHKLNKALLSADLANPNTPASDEWQEFQRTFTVQEDFAFGEDTNYPFYIYLAKNGWIEFKEPILVRGSKTGPYKPSQFDDAYKVSNEAKELANDAQKRAIQVAQGTEAVRTQMTLLAGSFAIKNLNSAGDLISGINLGANGHNRFVGKLTHITGETLIDNAVIKSAMIDKLKTANFEAGSVTTNILGAEAVTAEKVKFDTAFIQRLVSQQAFINELFAKQATITKIQSIDFSGEHIKGGKISSLNGVTDFDLQTGWIEMNSEGVGIRNKFPGRPLQYLTFGAGRINDIDGSYTALLSNRNGLQAMDSTSAGIQIWNGRSNEKVRSAITFYGQRMDFLLSGQQNLKGVSIDVSTREINGLLDVYIKDRSLAQLFNLIDKNFKGIEDHLKRNGLGAPGYYRTNI